MIVGRRYLEHSQPVVVVAQWSTSPVAADSVVWLRPPKAAPRNVLVERADGCRAGRRFRGLRKIDGDGPAPSKKTG